MPSAEKLAHFLSSSALCAAGVVILGFGMSTDWADAVLDCAPTGSEVFNGTSSLKTGLFNGTETKIRCPRIDSPGKTVSGKLQIRLQLIFYMLDYAILHCICLYIIYCLFKHVTKGTKAVTGMMPFPKVQICNIKVLISTLQVLKCTFKVPIWTL